jgi:hypothetical protein
MKTKVLLLIFRAACAIFLIYRSLQTDLELGHRLLDEVFAIFFAIRFYDTYRDLKNKN